MFVAFRFTYCNVGSWNGVWTGAQNRYEITRKYSRSQISVAKALQGLDLDSKDWIYDFGDGWTARVTARAVDAKEAAKIRKYSDGFAGREWMVDSILKYNKILSDRQIAEIEKQRENLKEPILNQN